jgi:hypothetical protein
MTGFGLSDTTPGDPGGVKDTWLLVALPHG